VTQTTSLLNSAGSSLHPKLRELLESGKFDWDDLRQREMYLKYWISRPIKQEEDPVDR